MYATTECATKNEFFVVARLNNTLRMIKKIAYILTIITLLITESCRGEVALPTFKKGLFLTGENIPVEYIGSIRNGKLIVKDTIDMKGRTCSLPADILLDITKGQIKNGELIGHGNLLKCSDNAFDRVQIRGEWIVSTIKSSFFADREYDNAISDIIALSSGKIKNKIIIEKGNYQVTIPNPWQSAITLNSNTELTLNGTILLTPNDYPGCKIINVKGNDIIINGRGRIIGDKEYHKGKTGEWGMGINVDNVKNVKISGLTIEACWGDCIYIGKAERVKIEKCSLKNSRRQGISVTAANNVKIRNCQITSIKGTAPEYAIDVEPNKGDTCSNIIIDRIFISDCQGGILSWGGAGNASVRNIKIQNCVLKKIHKTPFRFDDVDNVTVEKCNVSDFGQKDPFTLINLRNFKKRNIIVE